MKKKLLKSKNKLKEFWLKLYNIYKGDNKSDFRHGSSVGRARKNKYLVNRYLQQNKNCYLEDVAAGSSPARAIKKMLTANKKGDSVKIKTFRHLDKKQKILTAIKNDL